MNTKVYRIPKEKLNVLSEFFRKSKVPVVIGGIEFDGISNKSEEEVKELLLKFLDNEGFRKEFGIIYEDNHYVLTDEINISLHAIMLNYSAAIQALNSKELKLVFGPTENYPTECFSVGKNID